MARQAVIPRVQDTARHRSRPTMSAACCAYPNCCGRGSSVNKVILIGNLGRDPELRSTQDGLRIANLAVATSESWRDRVSGERKERTEWHRVVIFNERLAEIAEKYLKKGSKVYLEGALQTRKWTDQGGQERYTTEIVLNRFRGELTMLDGAGGARGAGGPPMEGGYDEGYAGGGFGDEPAATVAPARARTPVNNLDDDIPF
jgi:single-strand DNA-binding protein